MQPGPFNNRDKKLYNNIADILGNIREAKKADKDYDGDGKVESGTAEWKGSRDKAIKKAMATRNEEVEELDELKAGTYYKAHQRAHQEKISADDEAAMGTPGAAEDSKKRARQMKKFMKAAASRSEDGKTRKESVEHLDEMRPHGMNLSVGSIQDTPSMQRYYAKLKAEREARANKPKPSDDLKGGKRPEKKLESVEYVDEVVTRSRTYVSPRDAGSGDHHVIAGSGGKGEPLYVSRRSGRSGMTVTSDRSKATRFSKDEAEKFASQNKGRKAVKAEESFDHFDEGKLVDRVMKKRKELKNKGTISGTDGY